MTVSSRDPSITGANAQATPSQRVYSAESDVCASPAGNRVVLNAPARGATSRSRPMPEKKIDVPTMTLDELLPLLPEQ